MSFLRVFLLPIVIEAALNQLSTSIDPKTFSVSNGGVAYTKNLADYSASETFPVVHWSLWAWVYLKAGGGTILQTLGPSSYLDWTGTKLSLYSDVGSTSVTTKEGCLNKWIFTQLGATSAMTYVAVTIRGGNQYFVKVNTSTHLKSSSSAGLVKSALYMTVNGYYMDLVLDLNRAGTTEALIKAEVLSTFLCSAQQGTACRTCHSSCKSCTGNLCSLCADPQGAKVADGAFCLCGTSPTFSECLTCHPSCSTCAMSNDPTRCTGCANEHATLSNPAGGICYCGVGYVPHSPAVASCVGCYPGCSYCVDSSEAACMNSEDSAIFAIILTSSYQLPLLEEASGLICYRQTATPSLSCDPYTAATGQITSDASRLHPTLQQCYKLLKATWPVVAFWFPQIWPHFTPPASANEEEVYLLKAVLWLWILEYGPSALISEAAWQTLVAVFNNGSLDWAGLLGWSDGYLADGIRHSYPASMTTPPTSELSLFNSFSQVCDLDNCGYKPECLQVAPSSTCATTP